MTFLEYRSSGDVTWLGDEEEHGQLREKRSAHVIILFFYSAFGIQDIIDSSMYTDDDQGERDLTRKRARHGSQSTMKESSHHHFTPFLSSRPHHTISSNNHNVPIFEQGQRWQSRLSSSRSRCIHHAASLHRSRSTPLQAIISATAARTYAPQRNDSASRMDLPKRTLPPCLSVR